MCYRCFWPKSLCWCKDITPIETRTKFLILIHPKEYKQIKAATGRFTHLCLKNSELHMGVGFDEHEPVQSLINDPRYFPMLLYPGETAINISEQGCAFAIPQYRQLLVIILDATWRLSRKMLHLTTTFQNLPRLMFVPGEKSRYMIKKQPHDWCLSTIETAHELMTALEKAGMDTYARPTQMLDLFLKMQEYQIACCKDPAKQHYRPWEGKRFR
jgi:DTW domain-containing protein